MKKALSFIVAVILLISAVPFGVSAEDGVPTEEKIARQARHHTQGRARLTAKL